jgi:hypothetical protein
MKAFVLYAVLLTSVLGSFSATAADSTEPPVGIAADNWIPISDKLGFVVVKTERPQKPELLAPGRNNQRILLNKVVPPLPAAGYFMVRTKDGWRRLVVMSPADLAATNVD